MPPLTPEEIQALLNYLLTVGQQQVAPLNMNFGQVPGDPEALDYQKDSANYLQDRNQLMTDPFSIAGAGPGSYDAASFDPQVEMTPIQRPGEQQLQFYMNSADGTIEKMIADEIANGGTASSAFAAINEILASDAPELAETKATMLSSIPKKWNEQMMVEEPDYNSILSLARDLEKAVATDPIGNYQDPETGQWYDRKETPSKAAQQFTDAGLPLPTQQYEIQDLMGGDWQQATGGLYDQESFRKAATEMLVQPLQQQAQSAEAAAKNAQRPQALTRQPEAMDAKAAGDPSWFMNLDLRGLGGQPAAGGRRSVRENNRTSGAQRAVSLPARQAADAAQEEYMNARRSAVGQEQRLFNQDYYRNVGRVNRARDDGRTPLTDATLARRMAALAAGLPGGVFPGA